MGVPTFEKGMLGHVPTAAIIRTGIRLALGTLFVWNSIPKIQQPLEFLDAIYHYELVGPLLAIAIAKVLPWLELFLGACLILRIADLGAWTVAAGLLTLFFFAKASAVARGLSIPCGCSGKTIDAVTYGDVLQAGALLLGALSGFSLAVKDAWTGYRLESSDAPASHVTQGAL